MTPALKLDSRAGNATLTTVLSMKAMLVPRMAAARIHGPDCGRQGESAGAERMAASSQGGFIPGKDAIGAEEVSGIVRRGMFAVGCFLRRSRAGSIRVGPDALVWAAGWQPGGEFSQLQVGSRLGVSSAFLVKEVLRTQRTVAWR